MVPESSLNSAFVENEGKWVFCPEVIATNLRGKPSRKDPSPLPPKREMKTRRFYTPVQ
jgi:hypothetical protein